MVRLFAMAGLGILSFCAMEGFAWLTHRYVMHGWLWSWHRSHHEPRTGALEMNDLFFVVFALPAILLIWLGVNRWPFCLPAGVGVTAYGAVYLFFHDGLVHERFALPSVPGRRFWRRRIQAHRIHHAVRTRTGCVSYGFLLARPPRELKRELDAVRRQEAGV